MRYATNYKTETSIEVLDSKSRFEEVLIAGKEYGESVFYTLDLLTGKRNGNEKLYSAIEKAYIMKLAKK